MSPSRNSAARLAQIHQSPRLPESYLNSPYLVTNRKEGVFSWQYRYAKRFLDLAGSAGMIVVFAIPSLIIAASILCTSPGPLFYREERVGRHGVPFRIWKFRTMYCESDLLRFSAYGVDISSSLYSRAYKTCNDPRITRIGRFLRQWSLDELPQVFNILAGEMSLVGPRPIVSDEAPRYGERLRYYMMAKPGLSGLWQVSGRSTIDYTERAKLDATYVRKWNMISDTQILLRTIPAVLSRVGAW